MKHLEILDQQESTMNQNRSSFDDLEEDLSKKEMYKKQFEFEVSDEQWDVINFSKSTFLLGRAGTGKSTVLMMKLLQKEQSHALAAEEAAAAEAAATDGTENAEQEVTSTVNDRRVLRQLFVTVNPKLCEAVRHRVVQLKRSMCDGNISTESNYVELPNTFAELPINCFPLVITFEKFLKMLDGTIGNSYFEKFNELSEVTYERFASIYWPHFNLKQTKIVDSSIAFLEIISQIKGGMQVMETDSGKLSREHYLELSGGRASTLTEQIRGVIYDLYVSYEKMKMEKGHFDLADFAFDLHRRLRINTYEGNEMDFVYIDEVQDLTISQVGLFKYVCQNVEEGFVFCGDTAQTIGKGVDFRFDDIKSLFYQKFVTESNSRGKVKISKIFSLNQNFRTHDAVLRLSHSILDIIHHFFPHSIDNLKPETSVIHGESPVVLQCNDEKTALVNIFGNSGDAVGFGAEQVILVRDDSARKEISNFVGKQALVLTILECKGLQFQDVLLYNFLSSSPLKTQWRLIYKYMKDIDMLEPEEYKSYPSPGFNEFKHNVLCTELKQLYVAITRTEQRLWIFESAEKLFSKPMLDYWNKKSLVQFKELDNTFAQAMKAASIPEEWQSRGEKLYYKKNYETAEVCFERAGNSHWKNKSKAAGLWETAKRLRDLDPQKAKEILLEAAKIFEGLGMSDTAAQCVSDLGNFDKDDMNNEEANVARMNSDVLPEVDLMGKASEYELMVSDLLGHGNSEEKFSKDSIDRFFKHLFHLDWKKSLKSDMVYLRAAAGHKLQELAKEVIYNLIKQEGSRLTYSEIGRVVVLMLGTSNIVDIATTRFEDYPEWKKFIHSLQWNPTSGSISRGPRSLDCISSFHQALKSTCSLQHNIPPNCLFYLIERLLLFTSCREGLLFATKSSFFEWFINQDENFLPNMCDMTDLEPEKDVLNFIANLLLQMFQDYLHEKTILPLMLQRSVTSLCLIHLISQEDNHLQILKKLMGQKKLRDHLPRKFHDVLQKKVTDNWKLEIKVIAEAFILIDNPLTIVSFSEDSSYIECPKAALFVDLMEYKEKKDVLQVLFPEVETSDNGEGAINSAHRNNTRGDKNKSKKSKGGRKGKK